MTKNPTARGAWPLRSEAAAFRVEFNTVGPHEHLAWDRPGEVHLGLADRSTPNFPDPENLPTS